MSELKARHVVDVYDDYAEQPCEEHSRVYLKSEADKVIADLEESHKMEVEQLLMEIVGLKEQYKDMDVTHTVHIAKMNAKIEELESSLESEKASRYAESVDAGMRERRLRRAVWLARAERAKEKQQLFHFSLGYEKLCIDGFYDPYSGRRELSPKQWIKAFNKVEVKLLKKAEEYK